MRHGFYWDSTKANIGCGALLILLGLVLVSPVVAWLIKAVGWILVVLGIVVVILGIASLIFGNRRQDL